MMRILGLDPGLVHTGWGIIEAKGNQLIHIANGSIDPDTSLTLPKRLAFLYEELLALIDHFQPKTAAVEETFVNQNPVSTLKLGAARGVVMMTPAYRHIPVSEYPANKVKKSVTGVGHAEKQQVSDMIKRLLPTAIIESEDAADALAVAICHAHYMSFGQSAYKARTGT